MTKILIATSLIVAGLATSASASESFTYPNASFNQPIVQQRTVSASQAYAYAPAQTNVGVNTAEQREFDRVSADTVSAH